MQKNRKPCLQDFPIHSVQKKGVEPSRYCYHTDLNRARLPIPPLLHEHKYYTIVLIVVNWILKNPCGRWDLNPHEHTPTRSLVLPVCQFQHSRLLFFNFLCPMIFSPTKSSIAQFHLNCKPVFRKFIPEFIESEYSKNPAHLCTGLSVMQKKGLEPS